MFLHGGIWLWTHSSNSRMVNWWPLLWRPMDQFPKCVCASAVLLLLCQSLTFTQLANVSKTTAPKRLGSALTAWMWVCRPTHDKVRFFVAPTPIKVAHPFSNFFTLMAVANYSPDKTCTITHIYQNLTSCPGKRVGWWTKWLNLNWKE